MNARLGALFLRRLWVPLAVTAGAILLQANIVAGRGFGAARGTFGPTSWPRFMLWGAALFAAAWAVLVIWRMLLEQRSVSVAEASASTPAAQPMAGEDLRAALGIAVVLAYGFSIPVIGFAFATFAFFLAWMLLGGIRRVPTLALVGGLGTIALLYVFAKLALMPLDRGQGWFDTATIALYRALLIY